MMLAFYKRTEQQETRYFYLHDYQLHLFHPFNLTVIWGKGWEKGHKKEFSFENQAEVDAKIRSIIQEKLTEGFDLLYSYPGQSGYEQVITDLLDKSQHNSASAVAL